MPQISFLFVLQREISCLERVLVHVSHSRGGDIPLQHADAE